MVVFWYGHGEGQVILGLVEGKKAPDIFYHAIAQGKIKILSSFIKGEE